MEVGADLVVNMDSDGQFDPATLPALIEPVVSGRADFSTASRFADSRLAPKMPWIKRWGNRAMSRLISRLIGQEFHDVSCGMRCYNRRAALNLNLMGAFTYTQEVFLNLAYKRLRLVEVPLRVEGERKHGKSRVARSVFRYGCRALAIIFRCYRDYRPMRFFGRTAAVLIAMAVLLEGFFFGHYLVRHSFHPHLWAGFTGAAMLFLGLLSLHMGLIGDMLARHRIYLEELLYSSRLQASDNGRANGGKPEKGNP
jgi:glycosyltransferase involved in cell wall biosynthesis